MRKDRISEEELVKAASYMRYYALLSIYAARSGHSGGSLSIMDIAAALYLRAGKFYPENPEHPERDRVLFSAGHKAPALYAGLGMAGFYDIKEMVTLRKFGSPFQGHPHAGDLPGIEVSTGSLGQGLSVACGLAVSAKMKNEDHRVFCITGDGEHQEGSIWESVMFAANYNLDNLIEIVDRNRLQIDGEVDTLMNISPLDEKYLSFGWHVISIDGHDMHQIVEAFEAAAVIKGKPIVIIADTVKGKGVSFMENVVQWHGKAPGSEDELFRALEELPEKPMTTEEARNLLKKADDFNEKQLNLIGAKVPRFSKDYWWNRSGEMKVSMKPNRFGFGEALAEFGGDPRLVTIHADISDSIKISDFEKADPARQERVLNAGIAEQNMITVAAGLAREGWIPITGTYGVFAAGRPWDQIRTTVCNDNLNVKIIGAHGGISVGPDGGTHQALEDISIMAVLPGMIVGVPSDSEEARKMMEHMLFKIDGPCYLRLAREPTPEITSGSPFIFGKANVYRFREERQWFKDAFSASPAQDYKNEGEVLSILGCGPILTEAMRAAYILKKEYGIESRVVNFHTIKPFDEAAVLSSAETGAVLTCEEHQAGGFGNLVSAVIAKRGSSSNRPKFDMVGVEDKFGVSGTIEELFHAYEVSAEFIVKRALALLEH